MDKYKEILFKYWAYTEFRSLQGEIIKSISEGKDTLGLMPTGGGKSITFQVPTMLMDGICIVISPLVALMKDQVENLREKNIKAELIFSGLQSKEIELLLNKCIYGKVKFLYISPERLKSESFINKLKMMKVCMIAIDESHCISQWGYDFRPSYLNIASIKDILPHTPILALTATATPEVIIDIQEKLNFKKENVFRKSFSRKNLIYLVRHTEDKNTYLIRILKKINASAIVYARSRRKTKEISQLLKSNGISAEFYHAGLDNAVKDYRQKAWKKGTLQVIVSTNAFGMGIDKSNVRCVVHMDPPDSLEAYFQEAGRAGRDEKDAYAVMLYNKHDKIELKKKISTSFPDKKYILRVYQAACNFLQLGEGDGKNKIYDFNIGVFCMNFKLNIIQTYNSLKILQRAGYLEITDDIEHEAKVHFNLHREELYKYKLSIELEKFMKLILRSYSGLFTDYVKINTEILSKKLNCEQETVKENLKILAKQGILRYIPRKKTSQIIFTQERVPLSYIRISKDIYTRRKTNYVNKISAIVNYCESENKCRSQILLSYFGEKNSPPCKRCDICKEKNTGSIDKKEFDIISKKIMNIIETKKLQIKQLVSEINHSENKVIETVQYLMDNKIIVCSDEEIYYKKKQK